MLDRHAERCAGPSEGIDHQSDQRAITQTGMCRDIDAVEQRARFRRIEHRCLSRRHDVPGPAHLARRIDRHDLAGDEPVEQMTDCGETTLGVASSRVPASIQVATCTGCTAPIDGTRGAGAPGQKFIRGSGLGPPLVRVADVDRKEFEEADRGLLAGSGGERRENG